MDPATEQKLNTAKQFKQTADQAFKEGKIREALMSYHSSLMYLNGLDKNAMAAVSGKQNQTEPNPNGGAPTSPKTEALAHSTLTNGQADEILEKVYANMAACHIKNSNWKRAIETAAKALAKNPDNTKALFRKGKAECEDGYIERGIRTLEEVKKKNPAESASVDAEIARFRAIDAQKEKEHKKKMKGFLNKAEKKGESISLSDKDTSGLASSFASGAKIEEVA
ncbi:TPR-like protein, partial [Schizophyllum commune Loenen D]